MVNFMYKAVLLLDVIKGSIKPLLKKFFFNIMELIYFNSKTWVSDNFIIEKLGSAENSETFFGYYDKYPENTEGSYLIFHRTYSSTKFKPDLNKPIEIILLNKNTNVQKVVGETKAYNWQQGARLMWLDNENFIYNTFENEFLSIKYCTKTDELIKYPFTINDSFGDIFSLTLNYKRLGKFRPDYGYQNPCKNLYLDDSNDGVFINDHYSKTQKLLISIESLKQKVHKRYYKYDHWVNHIMISPDGLKFIFIHRWAYKNAKRYDYLYLYDFKTKSLELLSKYGMVSHMNWITNEEIFGFLKGPMGNGYYRINLHDKKFFLSDIFTEKRDGHPTICNQSAVTDSYPNKKRLKNLFHYSFRNQSIRLIGSFKESTMFWGESRCDLHPRISDKSDAIYIDSVHEGYRSLYSIVEKK